MKIEHDYGIIQYFLTKFGYKVYSVDRKYNTEKNIHEIFSTDDIFCRNSSQFVGKYAPALSKHYKSSKCTIHKNLNSFRVSNVTIVLLTFLGKITPTNNKTLHLDIYLLQKFFSRTTIEFKSCRSL